MLDRMTRKSLWLRGHFVVKKWVDATFGTSAPYTPYMRDLHPRVDSHSGHSAENRGECILIIVVKLHGIACDEVVARFCTNCLPCPSACTQPQRLRFAAQHLQKLRTKTQQHSSNLNFVTQQILDPPETRNSTWQKLLGWSLVQ